MIIFLFGLPGSGKTFVGKYFSQYFRARYLDGDEFLTAEMKAFIKKNRNFNPVMTEAITRSISNEIKKILRESAKTLIVSQAMLIESNRVVLKEEFENIVFFQVICDEKVALKRIEERQNVNSKIAAELVTPEYAKKITKSYKKNQHELAASHYPVILNEGNGKDFVAQLYRGVSHIHVNFYGLVL